MALLTLVLAEAGNYVLTPSVFHGLAGNFCLCMCLLHHTRHSRLTKLAQNLALALKRRMMIISTEFGGKQSREIGPRLAQWPSGLVVVSLS